MQRVVITGFAVMAASGSDIGTFWANLAAGRSSLGPLTRVQSPRITTGVAGEIADFNPAAHFGKEVDFLDRFAQMAVVCARGALADAGLPARLDTDAS
ncbi:MAG: beta-ketoacyl synthase N-terminal-like domain-containing protein, partial [Streptosporangiaceae bacterium]